MKKIFFTLFAIGFVWSLSAQELVVQQKQLSLVTEHAATWCPICGAEAWDTQKYFVNNLDGNNAIVLSAHISSTSKLYSTTSKELLSNFQGVVYQPEFFFNTNKIDGTDDYIKSTMVSDVSQAAQQTPAAQTGVVMTYNNATDMLKVKTLTKFFQPVQGEFQLSILLVERQVYAEQASRSSNELHQNVIRKSLNTSTFGPVIASGSVAAGTEVPLDVAIKWDNQYDLGNIEIVTILWRRNVARYDFVNANYTKVVQEEQTTSTRNVDALGNRFTILPNFTSDHARIQLDLPNAFDNTEITLFDRFGREVRTLYRGNLQAGEQTIPLDRTGAEAAGMYFLRFRSGSILATRRVVFF